jgi:hypothetical protein
VDRDAEPVVVQPVKLELLNSSLDGKAILLPVQENEAETPTPDNPKTPR